MGVKCGAADNGKAVTLKVVHSRCGINIHHEERAHKAPPLPEEQLIVIFLSDIITVKFAPVNNFPPMLM